MRDTVRPFEEAFARAVGARRAFAFWRGRVALAFILKALGIGPGDEVVMPGYTCFSAVLPVKYAGARAVYVDIDAATFTLDARLLDAALTPRTRLIVAQHTFGYPCAMEAVMAMAGRRGLAVVEDCCPALGSAYRGRPVGTFGLAAYWSADWTKTFTTGLGGMATTSDAALAARIAALCRAERGRPPLWDALRLAAERAVFRLAASPRTTDRLIRLHERLAQAGAVVPTFSARDFATDMPEGFLRGMGRGQTRAGLREVRRLARNLAHRRRLGGLYDRLFGDARWPLPPVPDHLDPVLLRYPVRVANKGAVAAEARRRALDVQTWWDSPIHPRETPLDRFDYRPGLCPVAERVGREVVTLPTDLRTSPAAARRTAEFVIRLGRPAV